MTNQPKNNIPINILFLLSIIVITTLTVSIRSYAETTKVDPQAVNDLHNKLLYVMENAENLGYQGRYDELSAIVPQSFNVPLISQVILGRHWRKLDNKEQSDFIILYKKLIIATYASRFNSFNEETFLHLTTEELNRGRFLVKTELHSPGNEPVTLDYLMDQKNDNWMIITVIANGANDISIKRGEYADVINLQGYDALLEEIGNKIEEMAN